MVDRTSRKKVIVVNLISAGNKIVDEVGKLNFTGNIIPEAWYKTIIKAKTGKPNLRQ